MNKHIKLSYMTMAVALLFMSGCSQNRQQAQADKTATIANATPQRPLLGRDRDEHGCIASAGYTWSEARKDCIRLFEEGIRTESTDNKETVFIVFSPDSLKAELFFSDGRAAKILDRRKLPTGESVWNVEDDDTENVRKANGLWTISKRGKVIFRQPASETQNAE